MDNSASELNLDKNGICNFCREWEAGEYERKAAKLHPGLQWTLYELRKAGQGKKYDCLLGISGGSDSSMCLHYLVVENGIRPLCFSIDNGFNNPKADENIMRMVEKLKVPFYKYTIDIEEFVALHIAFVRAGLANIEIPSDHIIRAAAYKLAVQNDIKFIISGGNHATEGCMPVSWGYDPSDLYHIKAVFRKMMGRKLNVKKLPTLSLFQYIHNRFIRKIKIIQLLNFYDYDRQKSIELLKEKYGYSDYGEKHHESLLTAWFQNFYLPTKFGFDKRRPHFSSMINSGQMTREEALIELAKPLEYPKFGIEDKALAYPKRSYKDYPNSEKMRNFLSYIYRKYIRKFLY